MLPLLFVASASMAYEPPPVDPAVTRAGISEDVQRNAILACTRVTNLGTDFRYASGVTIAVQDGYAYVLTAGHALGQDGQRTVEFFGRSSYPHPEKPLVPIGNDPIVVDRLTTADFALLKVLLPVKSEFQPVVAKLAPPLERPNRFPVKCFAVGCSNRGEGPPLAVATTVIGKYLRKVQSESAIFWETESPHDSGRSGGPLFDKQGRVIGICSANAINAAKVEHGFFTHIDEIQFWMKKNGHAGLYDAR